jgi:hypothetical protein
MERRAGYGDGEACGVRRVVMRGEFNLESAMDWCALVLSMKKVGRADGEDDAASFFRSVRLRP